MILRRMALSLIEALLILRIILLTVRLWCHARDLLEHGNKHTLRGESQRGRDHKIGQVGISEQILRCIYPCFFYKAFQRNASFLSEQP